jgi:hypothetical protein
MFVGVLADHPKKPSQQPPDLVLLTWLRLGSKTPSRFGAKICGSESGKETKYVGSVGPNKAKLQAHETTGGRRWRLLLDTFAQKSIQAAVLWRLKRCNKTGAFHPIANPSPSPPRPGESATRKDRNGERRIVLGVGLALTRRLCGLIKRMSNAAGFSS